MGFDITKFGENQLATPTDKMYPVAMSSRPQVQSLDLKLDE